jgi:hypothetical protein
VVARVNLSVEVAHVYREQLRVDGVPAWQKRLQSDRAMVAWPEHHSSFGAVVFVDDYPDAYTPAEKERVAQVLNAHAEMVNCPLEVIAFESSCALVADELAANLDTESEGMRWSSDEEAPVQLAGDWLERASDGHFRATLIQKDGYYSCPALSAVWTLARLGVEPYREAVLSEAIRYSDHFEADFVMSVLPTSYIENEAAVIEVLRQLRKPRIALSRVQYIFA